MTHAARQTQKRLEREIDYWKRQFRLLVDWEIIYNEDNTLTGQSAAHPDTQKAEIFPYSFTGESTPADYILHEITHMAVRAIGGNREREEFFVQDVCRIFKRVPSPAPWQSTCGCLNFNKGA